MTTATKKKTSKEDILDRFLDWLACTDYDIGKCGEWPDDTKLYPLSRRSLSVLIKRFRDEDLANLTPEELCMAYRAELERLYGEEIAEKSRVGYYDQEWFYIAKATRYSDNSVGLRGRRPRAYRKKQVVELLEELKRKKPK